MDNKELKAWLECGFGNGDLCNGLENWWEMAPGADEAYPTVVQAYRVEEPIHIPWVRDDVKEYWQEFELWVEVWECGPFVRACHRLASPGENPYMEHGGGWVTRQYHEHEVPIARAEALRAALAWEEQWASDEFQAECLAEIRASGRVAGPA